MAKILRGKRLSDIQKQYRRYFLERLHDKFGVTSPAQLTKEQKREFFGGIPKEWLKTKKKLKKTTPKVNASYKDKDGDVFIVSSIIDANSIELVQEKDASNIIKCSYFEFKDRFVEANDKLESPLSIALIETSEVVATLNMMLRTVLLSAPETVKEAAKAAIKTSKTLLTKLAEEVRED